MKITPIKYAIHREGDSAVFGEDSFHVSIDDEGAGEYIVIESVCPSEPFDDNRMAMDYSVLKKIVEVADIFRKNEEEKNGKEHKEKK